MHDDGETVPERELYFYVYRRNGSLVVALNLKIELEVQKKCAFTHNQSVVVGKTQNPVKENSSTHSSSEIRALSVFSILFSMATKRNYPTVIGRQNIEL